ncbi:tape measure protein [Muricauda sp. 2012CJ35-5]|uniref:Tape measure protein n=1 Tax=Flagellimonas spongiicola TaxID=2942208 RepID=A0ABT0PQ71_9FLAO|nr:tape measure protein [Allomuricauda spongiicola]MCL6272533.1 tape measure protein [Allomuricauda spongiicola]
MSEAVEVLIVKKARLELKEAISDMTELNAKIIEIANNVNKFTGKPFTNPVPSSLPKRAQESSKWISDLNAANREAERLAGNVARKKAQLAAAESNNAKALAKLRVEQRLNNKALTDEAILSSKLVGAYQKLTTRRAQAARKLKDLEAANIRNNRAIRQAQKEFDKLDRRVRKADRATNDFRRNVGNYSSALGKASFALRSFIGVLGVYSGFEIARQVFEQVKAIDGLNLALQQVTETQEKFNAAQEFLGNVAEESGQDIFVLTERYTKFLAAAKTTNLTMEEINNIFRQVAKAGGVLGLSTDNINGAFRALEQILSKGKVQAEEIRGQLGERLPGAFQILAKSMGLTTQELSKQLELGNVLSDEVLPGFAKELEKTYNLNLVERVDNLAASQTRLGNAWKEFLSNVEGGEGIISNVFKDIFNSVTDVLNGLNELNKTFSNKQAEGEIKGISTAIIAVKDESERLNISFKDAANNLIPRYKAIISDWGEELSKVTNEQSKSVLTNFFNTVTGKFSEQEKTAKRAGEQMSLYGKAIETLEQIATTGKLPEETRKVNKATEETNRTFSRAKTTLSGSIASYRAIINELTDKRDRLATTSDEYSRYNQQINEAKRSVDNLKKGLVELSQIKDSVASILGASIISVETQEELAAGFEENLKNRTDKEVEFERQKQEALNALRDGELKNIESLTGEQTNLIKESLSIRLNLEKQYADAKADLVLGSIDSIFQMRVSEVDKEIELNQRRFEAILSNEQYTEEQKQVAREKFEKEQERLQRKKEKRERQGFLAQQGLAIAEIAINLARTISTINTNAAGFAALPPFGFGPIAGPPLGAAYSATNIPLALGIAAAQTGLIVAQTIPALEKGALNFEGGTALINDESGSNFKEIVQTPDGKMYMAEGRNVIADLPKGSNVYSASETENMLKDGFAKTQEQEQDLINKWLIKKAENQELKNNNMMRKEIVKSLEEGFKNVKVINHNEIVIEERYDQY